MTKRTRPPRQPRAGRNREKVTQNGRTYRGLHKLTVQKPYCAPARALILAALEPRGIKIYGYSERTTTKSLAQASRLMDVEMETRENLQYGAMAAVYLPMAIQSTFYVRKQQAGWAEYLIWRTKRMAVVGKPVDPKNYAWAIKHGGMMPPTGSPPWIEKSCSEGVSKWKSIAKKNR